MLYGVKIFNAKMKLKKVLSPKQVQEIADKKFKEGHSHKKMAENYRAGNGAFYKKKNKKK